MDLQVENNRSATHLTIFYVGLITAYIGAQPLPGDEPDSFPDVLVC